MKNKTITTRIDRKQVWAFDDEVALKLNLLELTLFAKTSTLFSNIALFLSFTYGRMWNMDKYQNNVWH